MPSTWSFLSWCPKEQTELACLLDGQRVPSSFWGPVKWKLPLSYGNLMLVISSYPSPTHDDWLFLAQMLTRFHALFCHDKLVFPDKLDDRNYCKIALCHSVKISSGVYSFSLPSHKWDVTFKGNTIMVEKHNPSTDPHHYFLSYLHSWDHLFPLNTEL